MIDMDSHGLINLKLRTCLDIGLGSDNIPKNLGCKFNHCDRSCEELAKNLLRVFSAKT
mgnify:CR=1 FL=1